MTKIIEAAAEHKAGGRFQRDVEAVHRLGARVNFELLIEVGKRTGRPDLVASVVREFAAIEPDHLAALGGYLFPAGPMRVIGGAA
jgi:hypothetical protein